MSVIKTQVTEYTLAITFWLVPKLVIISVKSEYGESLCKTWAT